MAPMCTQVCMMPSHFSMCDPSRSAGGTPPAKLSSMPCSAQNSVPPMQPHLCQLRAALAGTAAPAVVRPAELPPIRPLMRQHRAA
eukprot:1105573-Pyramimonas_sp.AAC.2